MNIVKVNLRNGGDVRFLFFLVFFLVSGCARISTCESLDLDDALLKRTAYMFLRDVVRMENAEMFEYSVRKSKTRCGYLVIAEMEPGALDVDIFIFIGRDGVFKADGPSGPLFNTRGDSLWGISPSPPFQLAADDD